MTSTLGLSLLAVTLGSISAGVTAAFLVHGGSVEPAAEAVTALAPEVDLAARLEQLESESEALRRQLLTLDERAVGEPRVAALKYATREELDALREELAAMIQGGATATGAALARSGAEAPAELAVQVAEALQAVRKDEEYEKALAGYEKRTAGLEERVAGWSKWLGLDEQQHTQLTDIMSRRDQMELEGLQAWQNGLDQETLDEMFRTGREEFRRSVLGVLSAQQAERFAQKFGSD